MAPGDEPPAPPSDAFGHLAVPSVVVLGEGDLATLVLGCERLKIRLLEYAEP